MFRNSTKFHQQYVEDRYLELVLSKFKEQLLNLLVGVVEFHGALIYCVPNLTV